MMALPCLLIGIMPTYAQIGYFAPLILLVLRVLQGAAVGGEVPSAWTFVAEHAPTHHRGYALGFLQAGLTFGYLLGALTATLLAQLFTPAEILDYAWRFPLPARRCLRRDRRVAAPLAERNPGVPRHAGAPPSCRRNTAAHRVARPSQRVAAGDDPHLRAHLRRGGAGGHHPRP